MNVVMLTDGHKKGVVGSWPGPVSCRQLAEQKVGVSIYSSSFASLWLALLGVIQNRDFAL